MMKIEKINDRQIRCTLTGEDLASRDINIRELAYGSDKAKQLFSDMMQVAERDFGFEAENIPLMIEAVPISVDTIVLIITKIEDPDELDTRFSRFSPEDAQEDADTYSSYADIREQIEGADDVLDLIRRISEGLKHPSDKAETKEENSVLPADAGSENAPSDEEENDYLANLMRTYMFHTLDEAIRAAGVIDSSLYSGPDTLYKSADDDAYYLVLKKASNSASSFNKVCNILSEYAEPCKFATGMEAYFNEHMDIILKENALESLHALSS